MGDFFDKEFSIKKKPRKARNEQLDNLYAVPKKDRGINMPKYPESEPNIFHQADLLFLPNDNGYKYALVVVDVGNSITDAEPLQTKQQEEVLKAFKIIYNRNYLDIPKMITVDSGSEFKGDVERWFKQQKVGFKVAKTGRHRQLAKVERRNQIIGKALFKRMSAEEMLTGQQSKEWVDDLPALIKAMNRKTAEQNKQPKTPVKEKVLCEGDSCELLPIGSKVRVMLEFPINNITGQREFGKFRSTDIRWNTTIRTIENILLKPKAPPLYILNDEPYTGYTKNQLQIVAKNEKAPNPNVIRNKAPQTYIVEAIIDKKSVKRKVFYQIKWLGFPSSQNTWEPRTELIKNPAIKSMIEEFENN
jgi:hypothetical protein